MLWLRPERGGLKCQVTSSRPAPKAGGERIWVTLLSPEEPPGSVRPLHHIVQPGLPRCPQQRPLCPTTMSTSTCPPNQWLPYGEPQERSDTLGRAKRLKARRRKEGMGEWLGTSMWESDLRVLVGPQLKNQSVPLCFPLSLENLGGRPVDLSEGRTDSRPLVPLGLWK